jgi:hypothetical protein
MNVLKVGNTCHMYYEAGRKGVVDYQIGHAVSVDGTVLALWNGVKVRRSEDGSET